MEIVMSHAAAGDVERETTLSEADQPSADLPTERRTSFGEGDSCDNDVKNIESCEVSKDLVSDVPDPPNNKDTGKTVGGRTDRTFDVTSSDISHKLTEQTVGGLTDSAVDVTSTDTNHRLAEQTVGGLTDSAVDVTSTDTSQQTARPSSNVFTGNLLDMLMSNTNDDRNAADDEATTNDSDRDVVNTSREAHSSMTDASDGLAKHSSESSFHSRHLIDDPVDHCTANEQLNDDGKTTDPLSEQRSDSPSSGISSCSAVTGGYIEDKLNTSADDCATGCAPHRLSSNGDDVATDPSFVLPGETCQVRRSASSEAITTSVINPLAGPPRGVSDDDVTSIHKSPSSSKHKLSRLSDAPPETTVEPSLEVLSRKYGIDLCENSDDAAPVTCATNDAPVIGVGVDKNTRVPLASSMSSDSDTIPCGSHHSTNDGKQYVNVPLSPLHPVGMRKNSHLTVRSATVKQGNRPGAHIKVQVELKEKNLDKLKRYDVHRLLERGPSRWQCDRHKGPHIVLLTLLFMPVALIASTAVSLYLGTISWYNVLCYLFVEGAIFHKALFCPILVLTYPIVVFVTAFGVGLYASVVQVSWHLFAWQKTVTDYEKGFYGWLCAALDMVQCAPYGVIVLNADVARTLAPTQDETEV